MLRPSLAILFLSVALGACEGVNGGVVGGALSSGAPPASGQNWVCGQEYVNHAWGYQRRGAVVDISGTVWRHTTQGGPAAGDQMWQPKDVSRLTEETVGQRYKGATPDATKVPAAQMAELLSLIAQAAEATPPQPRPHGADMGQHLTYCYTHDAASRTYGQVMIDNKGDWDSSNPSPAAARIRALLRPFLGTAE